MHHHEICNMTQDTHKAKEFFLSMLAYMITPAKLMEKMESHKDKFQLYDMRDYEDYIEGHIPYAQHVPFEEIEDYMEQFDKDKVSIFYGYSPVCQRGTKAAYILADKGYPVKELMGGFKIWKKLEMDIVKNDSEDFGR